MLFALFRINTPQWYQAFLGGKRLSSKPSSSSEFVSGSLIHIMSVFLQCYLAQIPDVPLHSLHQKVIRLRNPTLWISIQL